MEEWTRSLLRPFQIHWQGSTGCWYISQKWVIKFNGLFWDSGHWGPCSQYKLCNHNLYVGVIIFPHRDNTQHISQKHVNNLKIISQVNTEKHAKLEQLECLHSDNTPGSHNYPYYWSILDPKSKQDKNTNLSKIQISKFSGDTHSEVAW